MSEHRPKAGSGVPMDQLVPQLYEQLQRVARRRMRGESPEHTLEATGLVHEAYIRLRASTDHWEGPAHFCGAAAEAMRRILVERARRKQRDKHGGNLQKVDLAATNIVSPEISPQILALSRALDAMEAVDVRKSEIVKLRYFAGFTIEETAELVGISISTVKADWTYARAWLQKYISETPDG